MLDREPCCNGGLLFYLILDFVSLFLTGKLHLDLKPQKS